MLKVVIIGGGFAGVNAAKALKYTDVEILLLDRTNYHLFQPLLYQVATSSLSPSNIASPLREIFCNQSNVAVVMANVVKIETQKKQLTAEDGQTFSYDYLIVAPGARHSYFGHEQWEGEAPGLKTIMDASRIRERLLMAFERAERCEDLEKAQKYLNFAIVGGGPTGVETAGSIAEFAHQTLRKNFRRIKPESSKIYLIEGAGQLLPSFPKKLADRAKLDLEQMGVTVLLNSSVTDVTSEGLYLKDHFLDAPTIIWAAGNTASPLLKTLNTALDNRGRVIVHPDLSIPNHPEVFVVGDAAACNDKNGNVLPAIAPVAIQQGKYVAKIIKKHIPEESRTHFSYFDKGMVATIGRGRAVVLFRKIQFTGFFAWLVWGVIHIFYLISFKNRLLVMMLWIFLYISGSRPDRIIRHSTHT
ncbi:MAG: NAD(P)/FAD-dependent oxidoreductase [Parachlamydiaceae bacterium]|nr:NAD(P)/FAD-dependent oxidoreductase [Parachlamydiaceae bacterium]